MAAAAREEKRVHRVRKNTRLPRCRRNETKPMAPVEGLNKNMSFLEGKH